MVEEAGMRKASGSFDDAFLAILGLAICGSCSMQFKNGLRELLYKMKIIQEVPRADTFFCCSLEYIVLVYNRRSLPYNSPAV